MIDFLFTCAQLMCIAGCAYSAYLVVIGREPSETQDCERAARNGHADEAGLWRGLGYYV